MCGRFVVEFDPGDLEGVIDLDDKMNDLPGSPNYNVCPTNPVHAVVYIEGRRRLGTMRWGFLPHWYKSPADTPLIINARSETIAKKPAFAEACRTRRCLIPATGFYEWTKDENGKRLPWYIHTGDEPILFAGVWQVWGQGETQVTTCAIVTTAANGPVRELHHRMPVRVAPDDAALWLGEEGKGAAVLMKAPPGEVFRFHRVDVAVNSNRASGPDLVKPLAS